MTPETIRDIVAWSLGLTPETIQKKTHAWDIAHPRMVAAYLMRRYTGTNWSSIANLVGLANHSSALQGAQVVSRQQDFFAPMLRRAQHALFVANDRHPLPIITEP